MHQAFVQASTLALCWSLALPLAAQSPAGEPALQDAASLPPLQTPEPARVRLSLINTSGATTLEAMTYKGGSWVRSAAISHIAVLVQHGDDHFLYDSGLGRQVDPQFKQDMPWFYKPAFSYDKVQPARDQLDKAGLQIPRIVLSHSHWDHASGLVDFPNAEVWTTQKELAFTQTGKPPAIFPSQVQGQGIKWHVLEWSAQPYRGYNRSLDLYQDGRVVLVPMEGHTPGGIGMFVKVDSGREFFFIGDTAWRLNGIKQRTPKFWFARNMVDHNPEQTLRDVEAIAELSEQLPELTVVPAHDRSVHDLLGYFPQWID